MIQRGWRLRWRIGWMEEKWLRSGKNETEYYGQKEKRKSIRSSSWLARHKHEKQKDPEEA